MLKDIKTYSQSIDLLNTVINYQVSNALEAKAIKHHAQDAYSYLVPLFDDKSFLNWGLWDKKLYQEYQKLTVDFSTIYSIQNIYSPMLIYYLIRPLIKANFYDRRLLDIGCGNGINLKICSTLLKTTYALGLDLAHPLVSNATQNFHKENEINYIQSDAENLPFENESFDIITNLESSHLYPQIDHFFSEVERVLSPGGLFCYADIHFKSKQQAAKLEAFIKTKKNVKLVYKHNITKMVQASIYQRIIKNERLLYGYAQELFGSEQLSTEFRSMTDAMGLTFLPWWKIWFKNSALKDIAKYARNEKYWGKKHYFYYLIQKF